MTSGNHAPRSRGRWRLLTPACREPGHYDCVCLSCWGTLRPAAARSTAGGSCMKAPRITDSSLRDGSHPMRHQFTVEQVRAVAQALDEAGVPVIEVTHGDGLAGSSIQYGFSRTPEMELIAEARSVCKQARIAVLLLPGIGTLKELKEAAAQGAQVVRIATQCTEADISQQHFESAREMGLETVGFLMMAHMR